MKSKALLYLTFLTTLFVSCITPIKDFEQVANNSFLTVESYITDQPGQQRVRIYMSSNNISGGFFTPITGARVYIIDEKGVRENLTELSTRGTYFPSSKFVGRVGGTYTLNIETTNGKKYQSVPETMKSVPEIENIITQFEVVDIYPKGNARRGGFNVYVDFQDPPTTGDNYQWYWKHYQRAPICESCVGGFYNFVRNTCEYPSRPTDRILNYQCDGDCWDITSSTDLNIFSDTYLNGKRITGRQVARIPFDGISKYYFQFEQRGITRNAYNYYQSLAVQTQNTGTLFDVPAETRFSFNIKSTTNPEEKILGLFDVYSVRKRIFYIDRSKGVPAGENPVVPFIPGEIFMCNPGAAGCKDKTPCIDGLFRTPFKPAEWKD
jgi:hypothetical protein